MMQFPNIKRPPLVIFLIISLSWFMALPASAQDDDAGENTGITLTAAAGFDGFYKTEYWLPVQISVANDGPAVEGELRVILKDTSPTDRIVYNTPIILPTRSNKRVTLYVQLPRATNTLKVELLDDNGQLITKTTTNSLDREALTTLLYGVVSSDPGELSFLEDVTGGRSQAAVAFLDINDLPEAAAAWNALDVLVFDDVDTGQLTAEQLDALQGWVNTGGQLVVTGGPGWQKTTAALADMLPVTVSGSQSVDDLPALSGRTGFPFRDPGPYLVAASSLRSGELLFHQDGLPLLARQSWGRGAVHFLALDPKLAPLLDWDGSKLVWAEVANSAPALSAWGGGVQNNYAAATAVTSLPSLALPSTLQLILFLLIYVIVVGPVNYFVLKRLQRRELAWATIPALVILFTGLAYFTGFQLKGNDVIINQMSIAHGRVGGDQARVQTLVGLYSPRRRTYDLIFPGDALARPFDSGYGPGGGSSHIDAITRSNELVIKGVRVDVSDTETFIADSYHPAVAITGQATLRLDGNNIRLDAVIQNDSDVTLENAALLLGANGIALGDLKPGQSGSASQVIGKATVSSSGAFAPGAPAYVPGPGYGSPLMSNAEIILGTADYYNNRDVFPRWQLLQAIEENMGSSPAVSPPSNVLTLVAWSNEPQLDVALNKSEFDALSTTLYLLEVPLTQNIVSGDGVTVPVSLLNWEVLGENGVYEPSIRNLYLTAGSWVEFEYQPWPEFQAMAVNKLAIALKHQSPESGPVPPEIRLWDWQREMWVVIQDADWGETAVSNPTPYLGPGAAVRIRLQDNSQYGVEIQEVYPVLTGSLE